MLDRQSHDFKIQCRWRIPYNAKPFLSYIYARLNFTRHMSLTCTVRLSSKLYSNEIFLIDIRFAEDEFYPFTLGMLMVSKTMWFSGMTYLKSFNQSSYVSTRHDKSQDTTPRSWFNPRIMFGCREVYIYILIKTFYIIQSFHKLFIFCRFQARNILVRFLKLSQNDEVKTS